MWALAAQGIAVVLLAAAPLAITAGAAAQGVPEEQGVQEVQEAPEVQGVPEVPEPEVPEPEAPEVQGAPEVPGAEVPVAEEVPPAVAPLEVVVNLPAHRVDVYLEGRHARSYRTCIGSLGHPTPTGRYSIDRVVWNPWWHPPDRPWAAGKDPMPPGPNNPMGRVKLYFKPLYFLHGTPDPDCLGQSLSHGCLRMANEDAIDLALLVHGVGSPQLETAVLERLVANPRATREIRLENPVPLVVEYDLVELMAEEVVVHPDVYRRSAGPAELARRVVEDLATRGIAPESLDTTELTAWLAEVHRPGGRRPIDGLLLPSQP